MAAIDRAAPVLVTGASGYIAGWIIKELLEAGRTVHGTVRAPDKAQGLEHLRTLAEKHPGRLKLFKADLLDAQAFDAPLRGCELVLHTASPFVISGFKDAHEALVRPAVEGTRNVLEAVNRTASVKRVVLTSSCAAIYGDNIDSLQVPGGVFTEAQWNTTSNLHHQPYSYSKTAAEKEAWAIAGRQSRWDLVTINPSLVLGPALSRAAGSTSIEIMKQLGGGAMRMGAPALVMGLVDVRDVAQAHVKAGDTPTASGRYIVSNRELSFLEMGQILRSRFGDRYPFPRRESPKFLMWLVGPLFGVTREYVSKNVGYPLRFDNTKGRRELGLQYRPAEQTLVEHFQQMLDDGLIKRRA